MASWLIMFIADCFVSGIRLTMMHEMSFGEKREGGMYTRSELRLILAVRELLPSKILAVRGAYLA